MCVSGVDHSHCYFDSENCALQFYYIQCYSANHCLFGWEEKTSWLQIVYGSLSLSLPLQQYFSNFAYLIENAMFQSTPLVFCSALVSRFGTRSHSGDRTQNECHTSGIRYVAQNPTWFRSAQKTARDQMWRKLPACSCSSMHKKMPAELFAIEWSPIMGLGSKQQNWRSGFIKLC